MILININHLLLSKTIHFRVQKRLQPTNHISMNQTRHNYDGPGKTTVSFLNEDTESGLIIDSYSQVKLNLGPQLFVFYNIYNLYYYLSCLSRD